MLGGILSTLVGNSMKESYPGSIGGGKNAGVVKGASDSGSLLGLRSQRSAPREHEIVGSLEQGDEDIRFISACEEAMVEGLEVLLCVVFI